MAERIDPAELREGDILMTKGTSRISHLIASADGGYFSHATYYTGRDSIIHSTLGHGVQELDLGELFDRSRYHYVGVYRAKLIAEGASATPVTEATSDLLGRPYDHASLWMIGVILGLLYPFRNLARRLGWAFAAMKSFAEAEYPDSPSPFATFEQLVRDSLEARVDGDARALTCTEVVTSGFWYADGRDRSYALRFRVSGLLMRRISRFLARSVQSLDRIPPDICTQPEANLLENCSGAIDQLLGVAFPGDQTGDIMLADVRAGTGWRDVPLSMVTPREMELSPSLVKVGWLTKR